MADDDVARLVDQLLALEAVRDWKNALQREIAKPTHALDALRHGAASIAPLRRVLDALGVVAPLKRVVADLHRETARAAHEAARRRADQEQATLIPRGNGAGGQLDAVAAARESWEKITRDELLRFANEQARPLVASRRAGEPTTDKANTESEADEELAAALPGTTASLTRATKPPPSTRFLYDSNDLLHILQSIKPANRAAATSTSSPSWGSIQLQFHSPSTLELRRVFTELAPSNGQIGVDDAFFPVERQAFVAEKHRVGELVCAHRNAAMARQFAKTGCPTSLRAAVWRQALGLSLSAATSAHYAGLQAQVEAYTYVTDDMYLLDLQRAIDSSDYFVFQDPLERVVMAFTRDADVLARAPQVNGAVALGDAELTRVAGEGLAPASACVPPNGVLPFSGLVLYVAPLAYLYGDDDEQLYFVFREMYVRYWSRLNAVATILPLCKLFEDLIQRSSPAAVFHLLNVGVAPLSVAFPWLQAAFSGVLEIQQLLLLWDRVVGYDALELLAVFAAALFHLRAKEWETVATLDDARALYAELLDVQAIPLLQEYLFLLA